MVGSKAAEPLRLRCDKAADEVATSLFGRSSRMRVRGTLPLNLAVFSSIASHSHTTSCFNSTDQYYIQGNDRDPVVYSEG